ncbi:hypothetical protein HMPREF1982_00203 [Clostridiales bacterium oral taxon 876 str. F0540]|nr:hypothetical protein HMPREF1982_00203 [Clostridiales bacterium oral taxon 876 str. F0540]
MKFKSLEASVKNQIKASMRRIAQKLIKLNPEKVEVLEYATAFNIWKSRYISTNQGKKYYDFLLIDEELYKDLLSTMEDIFLKEAYNIAEKEEVSEVKPSRNYMDKPATQKQIFYARYLMDMVKNETLPDKKYSMHEINLLISSLKNQRKSV